MSRYNADEIYCYPNSSVLKNKLEILEQDQLDAFEGFLKDKTMTSAVGNSGPQIFFAIKNNEFKFDDNAHEKMCGGFASIPVSLKKVN